MTADRERHHRRSIRFQGYDYSQAGAYFVTICVKDRARLFGRIVNGERVLNTAGNIVDECWRAIPVHFEHTAVDAFVVMPNHVHGIIVITNVVGATHASPLHASSLPDASPIRRPSSINPNGPKPRSIGAMIGSFKSAVTKRINETRNGPDTAIWQCNYYEHVIRNQRALDAIRRYIQGNSGRWMHDIENISVPPSKLRMGRDVGDRGE